MSATQQSDRTEAGAAPDGAAAALAPQRFRGQTVEEALRRARELLGDDAEIIEANRIRRGGIGGFFATELGVEVLAQSAASTVAQPGIPAGGLPSAPGDHTEHAAIGRPAADRHMTDRPVTDLGRTPLRGRAAWQAASAELATPAGDGHGATAAPAPSSLLEQLLERAAADELAAARAQVPAPAHDEPTIARPSKIFRSWRVADPEAASADRPSMYDGDDTVAAVPAAPTAIDAMHDAATADVADVAVASPAADAAPVARADDAGEVSTSFAEHFLRELMQDAEALRSDPARRTAPPARRRASRADAPTLPGIADRAPDTVGATAEPEPDVAAPAATVAPSASAAAPELAPAPAPRRRRAPRPKPAAVEPQLPLTSAEAAVSESAAPLAPAAPAVAQASPTTAINAIVDQCLQLATSGDHAPSKVAVAMTLADGQVVKVTVEMPRSR